MFGAVNKAKTDSTNTLHVTQVYCPFPAFEVNIILGFIDLLHDTAYCWMRILCIVGNPTSSAWSFCEVSRLLLMTLLCTAS